MGTQKQQRAENILTNLKTYIFVCNGVWSYLHIQMEMDLWESIVWREGKDVIGKK